MKKPGPHRLSSHQQSIPYGCAGNVRLELGGAALYTDAVHKTQGGGKGPAGKQDEKGTPGSAWGKLGPSVPAFSRQVHHWLPINI